MAYSVVIHLSNEEPIVAEMEILPSGSDSVFMAMNPRQRDGKDLRNLAQNVTQVIWPVARLTFLEILPTGEEEKVVGFVRE